VHPALPGRWGMLVEPGLDGAMLAGALQRNYGLAVGAVRFLPAGETAWCYQVIDEGGRAWFLKLGRPGAIEPARAEFALELAGVLAELGLPVPRPRPTQTGERWCWLEGLRMALFELIDGQPLSDQDLRLPELTRQAGRLVAAVHAATPALALPIPFAETFEVWTDGLRRCLAELQPGAGGLVTEARALVWPQRAALLAMQERIQALGEVARSQPRERVLCHGDLIGDNLLCDRGGRLWLVDWDGAALGPRERDLALFAGQRFKRFFDAYQADTGTHGLDPDLVAFFLLRRNAVAAIPLGMPILARSPGRSSGGLDTCSRAASRRLAAGPVNWRGVMVWPPGLVPPWPAAKSGGRCAGGRRLTGEP
jgi:spectinomycin phosphotransferase